MGPVDVVLRLVTGINAHDVAAIGSLLTDDHRFVDSLGSVVAGRANVQKSWQGYFAMVPDYRIEVRQTCHSGEVVVVLGSAHGTYAPDGRLREENRWEIPAAWRAVVRGDRVAEWQVYADNEPVRRRIAAHSAQQGGAADRPAAGS